MFSIRRMQLLLGLAAVAALVGAQEEVAAATLEVTASVPDSCTVAGGTLAFGTINPGGPDVPGSGQINIDCTSAAENVAIALDGGLHHGAKNNGRAMKRSSSNDYLNYRLYTAGLGQLREPDVAVPVSGGLSNGQNSVVVDGVIDGSQTVPGGEYSDTVQITLTFN
jgi:spore coat protein U-like protein